MSENTRQVLGLIAMFAGAGLTYALWGVPGAAGYCFGLSFAWLTIGLATGYWIGTHAPTEQMVAELMRRIRTARSSEREPGSSDPPV